MTGLTVCQDRCGTAPILVMQGGRDTIVPPEMGRRLLAAAQAPAELWHAAEAGHNDLTDFGILAAAQDFVRRRCPRDRIIDSPRAATIFAAAAHPRIGGVAVSGGSPRELQEKQGVARIAGVNIPTNKRVTIGLRYIYGIGPTKAAEICERLTIPDDRRVNQLSDEEVLRIREMIDRDYRVEGDLRREVAMNIKRLMDLGCYRGLRHRRGLPVRGQRTHTNARTRKGKAVAIAGKKKVTK